MRPTALLAGLGVLCAWGATASTARADLVLLLPARGQVAGAMLSATLESETRFGIVEIGHKLVDQQELTGALRQIPDGSADDADEFATLARFAHADWVVLPTVFPQDSDHRLELVAYYAKGARSESVTRDVETDKVHAQVVEMLRVLLRAEGVGTAALPWEKSAVRPAPTTLPASPAPAPKTPARSVAPAPATPWPLFFAGVGVGVSSAVSRPDQASGSSTSSAFTARAGVSPAEPIDLALQLTSSMSGPRATTVDASGRYLIPVAGHTLRVGPEAGVGVFVAHGGSESKSLLVRATVAASLSVSRSFSVDAQLGDLRWVPASSGTIVLAGATLQGVLRF